MLLQNANRKKEQPALKPADFFPSLRKPDQPQSADDLKGVFGQVLASYGGTFPGA